MSTAPVGPTTATVETLTASVHVLQVGQRQITLSVAKQLDRVEPVDIEPFGRIRAVDFLESANPDRRIVEVIGVSKIDGSLVRAHIRCGQPPIYAPGLVGLADAWQALPLIVLAGLR